MEAKLQIRPGLLERLRSIGGIPSEEAQARMIGVDRTTLRRIDKGAPPSSAFIAQMVVTYGMGIGEMFEVIRPAEKLVA